MSVQLQNAQRTNRAVLDILLGLWWISWFGFIGGFLWIAGLVCHIEIKAGHLPSPYALALIALIPTLWVSFFVLDSKAMARTEAIVRVETFIGTALTIFTCLAIWFLSAIELTFSR